MFFNTSLAILLCRMRDGGRIEVSQKFLTRKQEIEQEIFMNLEKGISEVDRVGKFYKR